MNTTPKDPPPQLGAEDMLSEAEMAELALRLLRELAADDFAECAGKSEALATGEAGTVYLCHPFVVHSAQPHRGRNPRFMAQPPLLPSGRNGIGYDDEALLPVARAVR